MLWKQQTEVIFLILLLLLIIEVKDIRTPLTLRTHNQRLLTKPLYSVEACTPTEYNSKYPPPKRRGSYSVDKITALSLKYGGYFNQILRDNNRQVISSCIFTVP